jgi:HD superfamily phosphodiesterase
MSEEKKERITFEDVKTSEEIKTYIRQADLSLRAMGYTEHSFPHVMRCANMASDLLSQLGYGAREVDLVKIAGFMHDIGNVINRVDHAQSGAMMAFRILDKMGMPVEDIASVVTAIGNHDEGTAFPVNAIAAALILADKTDVRRSRVRNSDFSTFDIHDRVNYAVEESNVRLDLERKTFSLILKIDTEICAVMSYFEIFLNRMLLCRKAADFFDLTFKLEINGSVLL